MTSLVSLSRVVDLKQWDDVVIHVAPTNDLWNHAGAIFSPCERYRYVLWRIWNPSLPFWSFGMLNPSTADHMELDPTVDRCRTRAISGGAGGLLIWNLFAFRATDPKDMKAASDPVGPQNDRAIQIACEASVKIVAGWGAHGDHMNRQADVRALLAAAEFDLHAIAFTKDGLPRHPLYLSFDDAPQPWDYRTP